MEAPVPSPQMTLLILLGASEWPLFPEFKDSVAFANSEREIKAYFLDPKRFGLSPENVLDVFNSNSSSDELDAQIGWFLERRLAAMKATGYSARDLLVYFVGHGGFVGRDSDFYLAIRRTRMENPRASGIPMLSLADTLVEKARNLRRFIILDCCFAAAAFSAFQTGPAQVAIEKVVDAFEVRQRRVGFPAKGTALLCSSSQKTPSLLLPDGSSTMFTKAFLDALSEGLPSQRERLSLREVKDLAADLLSETRNAPRPVVLSPDQSEGDVADIPFFPNPRAEEERARQAEEERRRLVEESERTRRMEEERQRRVEEERARQAEKDRARKAREEQALQAGEERHRQAFELDSQLPHPTNAISQLPPAQPPTELITDPFGQPSTTAASEVDRPVHMIQQGHLPTRRIILVSGLTLAMVLILAVPLVGLYGRTRGNTPTPTAASGKSVHLQKIHMFNASTGWALTSDPSNQSQILHTTSGVTHWKDVSPAFDTSTSLLTETDFFDPSTAWVAATVGTTHTLFVYRTHDGGQIWQKAQLPDQGGCCQIFFLNTQVGWILLHKGVALGHEFVDMLHSSDGGATWKVISVSNNTGNTPTAIPFDGDKSGLSFVNETTGWLAGSSPAENFAWFYVTHDGGATWQHQAIPLPAGKFKDISTMPPVFFNATDGILPAIFPRPKGSTINIYITQDGGASWSSTGLVPVPTSTGSQVLDFIDAMHGWIVSNDVNVNSNQYIKSNVYSTSNGVESWTQHNVKLSAEINMIDFASPTQGWAIDLSQSLYQTTDSGQTWTKVTPTVA